MYTNGCYHPSKLFSYKNSLRIRSYQQTHSSFNGKGVCCWFVSKSFKTKSIRIFIIHRLSELNSSSSSSSFMVPFRIIVWLSKLVCACVFVLNYMAGKTVCSVNNEKFEFICDLSLQSFLWSFFISQFVVTNIFGHQTVPQLDFTCFALRCSYHRCFSHWELVIVLNCFWTFSPFIFWFQTIEGAYPQQLQRINIISWRDKHSICP